MNDDFNDRVVATIFLLTMAVALIAIYLWTMTR